MNSTRVRARVAEASSSSGGGGGAAQRAAAAVIGSSELKSAIGIDEVEKALKLLQNHRASGPDAIHNELLTKGGTHTLHALHFLFSVVWRETRVPEEW